MALEKSLDLTEEKKRYILQWINLLSSTSEYNLMQHSLDLKRKNYLWGHVCTYIFIS